MNEKKGLFILFGFLSPSRGRPRNRSREPVSSIAAGPSHPLSLWSPWPRPVNAERDKDPLGQPVPARGHP